MDAVGNRNDYDVGEPMNLSVLASGSRGNSILIWEPQPPHANNQPWPLPWAILVDVGLAAATITDYLKQFQLAPADIKAILISHAHGDHVSSLIPLWKKCPNAIVFAHQATLDKINEGLKRNQKLPGETRAVEFGQGFWLSKDYKLFAAKGLACEHNSAGCMSFIVRNHMNRRVAILNETGQITCEMEKESRDCHVVCLEANHDAQACLDNENRPRHVNERTYVGHLNNDQAADFVQNAMDAAHTVVALHLSSENNDPELVRRILAMANSWRKKRLDAVILASQEFATRVIEV